MSSAKRVNPLPHAVDTAIVGAGVAGLYAAFRLVTECPSPTAKDSAPTPPFAVFEASERVGGRLCTVRLSDEDPVVDLGAMRFLRSHELLTALVENVLSGDPGTQVVPFAQIGPDSTLYHLRGRTFSKKDANDRDGCPQIKLYGLPECWRGMSPNEVSFAIVQHVMKADGTSFLQAISSGQNAHRMWADLKKTMRYRFDGPFRDFFLHEITFSQLVLDRFGLPTLQYIIEGIGYDQSSAMTAAEVFEVVGKFAAAKGELFSLSGGMETVATGLCGRVTASGTRVFRQARLVSFDRSDDSDFKYVLNFEDSTSGSSASVLANNVILALPRMALEQLHASIQAIGGVDGRKNFLALARCAGYIPAVKIVMWFDEPWWASKYGLNAHLATDLPMRQCYFFGSTEPGTRSVMTAVYCTMERVQFWKAIQEHGRRGDVARDGGTEDADPAVVAEALRELRLAFGALADGVRPVKAVYKVWDGERDGDIMGFHIAQPGAKVWEVGAHMSQPIENERVFVCGEAYSDRHGWVEGALTTTEELLCSQFGLKAPSWLHE